MRAHRSADTSQPLYPSRFHTFTLSRLHLLHLPHLTCPDAPPSPDSAFRSVIAVVRAHKAQPAPGLVVDRPFPGPQVDYLDPWLMLDHFGPERVEPGDRGGLNPHPHRGFETVTLILDGAMEHRDSSGGRGVIRPGGVQWMTAASGIVHAEYREKAFVARGGYLHGIQLWVNLPRKDKMTAPGYQDLPAEVIPVVSQDGARVCVIAGSHAGIAGVARTFTPLTLLRATLNAGASLDVDLPADHTAAVYVVTGEASSGEATAAARQLLVFDRRGTRIPLRANADTDLLVLGGAPLGEPVVSWGPFVMSTREEIVQAQRDYAMGKMGFVAEE